MPDLSNLVVRPLSRVPALRPCDMSVASSSSLPPAEDLAGDPEALYCKLSKRLRYPISTRGTCSAIKREKRKAEGKGGSLADHVRAWVERKVSEGVEERECQLPFLTGAPKMVECRLCTRYVYPGEEVLCSVRDCREAYHITCAKQRMWKHSTKEFKCPRHTCFICKQIPSWRCVRCTVAWHTKCAPWTEEIRSKNRQAICWRHPIDWRQEKKD